MPIELDSEELKRAKEEKKMKEGQEKPGQVSRSVLHQNHEKL